MVKICSYDYPKSHEETYQEYYKNYPYLLHDFQKWCVESIVTGNHVLITAPTGTSLFSKAICACLRANCMK